jgi:hypothetical protein
MLQYARLEGFQETTTLAYWDPSMSYKEKGVVNTTQGAVFTMLHFLHNIRIGPINLSVCPWQAFQA